MLTKQVCNNPNIFIDEIFKIKSWNFISKCSVPSGYFTEYKLLKSIGFQKKWKRGLSPSISSTRNYANSLEAVNRRTDKICEQWATYAFFPGLRATMQVLEDVTTEKKSQMRISSMKGIHLRWWLVMKKMSKKVYSLLGCKLFIIQFFNSWYFDFNLNLD